jgi:hypothetical protein
MFSVCGRAAFVLPSLAERPIHLTNLAAGLSKEKLSHDEVLGVGKKAAADFRRLLNAAH